MDCLLFAWVNPINRYPKIDSLEVHYSHSVHIGIFVGMGHHRILVNNAFRYLLYDYG